MKDVKNVRGDLQFLEAPGVLIYKLIYPIKHIGIDECGLPQPPSILPQAMELSIKATESSILQLEGRGALQKLEFSSHKFENNGLCFVGMIYF